MRRFGDGRDWFFEKRFGMFVHWGIYAIPAWHEQHQWRGRVPRREYEKLAREFNPTRYNPDHWLDVAERTGMGYICFTTKHHDGFCLWNTAQTDFNVMHTPYGRDVLGMLAEACHRRGFPLCLYYSCVDWHHPNYPNQGRHHELPCPEEGDQPDFPRYLEYLKAQVRELCTQYGTIHGFWWDMNVPGHRDPSINALVRQLQPNAIINDRGYDEGDFGTPERDYDESGNALLAFEKPTEACQSVGAQSWGYRKDEEYYADRYLLQSIDRYLARGANYLLNVGPMADGSLPEEARTILERIGTWYHRVKESFLDTEPVSHLTTNRNVLLTRRDNTLYVHLCHGLHTNAVSLKPISAAPKRATLLNCGSPVRYAVELVPSDYADRRAYLHLRDLPVNDLATTVPVIKLEFSRFPEGPDLLGVPVDSVSIWPR